MSIGLLYGCSSNSAVTTTPSSETTTEMTTKEESTKETSTLSDKEKLEEATRTESEETTESKETTEATTTAAVASDENQPPYLTQILNKDGISYNDLGTSQIVLTVADGSSATVYCYEKGDDGLWKLVDGISEIPGWVGSEGVSTETSEWVAVTPKGLWNLGFAFGNCENPGTSLEYRDVTENVYWVDDPNSASYNRWVEWSEDADWSSAEHLCEIPQYAYAVNIEYNYENPVPGLGSAFFFHCGDSPTSGCVAVYQDNMVNILRWLKPGAKILITTEY